jgi:regulator of extracellular matrix RemA (YlzA/DUF370 family)
VKRAVWWTLPTAVIVMDSMHVVLSALQPETVAGRINAESEE